MSTAVKWVVASIAAVAFVSLAHAQSLESKNRQELKRADLTGTNMEVILSTTEYQPGDFIPRHIHHGEEAFYILQGAMVETPDGKQIRLAKRIIEMHGGKIWVESQVGQGSTFAFSLPVIVERQVEAA
jgi:light-regulated signal transduction histidine kinase (bacteriophytochrome)